MGTSQQTGDFYEDDLEYSERALGELFEHERYMLRLNLPE